MHPHVKRHTWAPTTVQRHSQVARVQVWRSHFCQTGPPLTKDKDDLLRFVFLSPLP